MKWLVGCLLLLLSGFALIKNNSLEDIFLLAVIPVVTVVGLNSKGVVQALGLVFLGLGIHYVLIINDFGTNSPVTYLGFYLVLSLSVVISHSKERATYFEYVLRLSVVLSVISLVYYILVLLYGEEPFLALGYRIGSIDDRGSPCFFFVNHRLHPGTSYFRSSGPFWEPGAFAVYLVLILFQGLRWGLLSFWRVVCISVAVLLTFSTTGLIMLMTVILYGVLKTKVLSRSMVFLALMFTASLAAAVLSSELIAGKIDSQSQSVNQDVGRRNTRFAIGLYDLQDFLDHNVVYGKGPSSATRYSGVDESMARANGLSNFLVKWGGIGLALLIGLIVKGGFVWTFLILVAGMSQDIFIYPLTWFLLFLNRFPIN